MLVPEPNLPGVMSVTDWDFLRPPSVPVGEDDHAHRPSLDDFDGEIAVFQVCKDIKLVSDLSVNYSNLCIL